MKKQGIGLLVLGSCLLFVFCCLLFIAFGCGQTSSGGGGTTGNYTLQGKVSLLSASSLKAQTALPVTDIVAIGSNGQPFLASYSNGEGVFSVKVNKGIPYVLAFYNKSGGKITLLGYLKQNTLNWHSLPIINPTGEATDLGTVEVNSASEEAVPSINITSLISQMNLVNQDVADYYGQLDEPLVVLTSLDVDNDGEFDFLANKRYLFSTYFCMSGNSGTASGEIQSMLNGHYNDSYKPCPSGYQMSLAASNDSQPSGALATFYFPQAVNISNGNPVTTTTVSAESNSGASFWSYFSSISGNPIVSPEVVPSGTYTVEVGAKTYIFKNFVASQIIKVNANKNIIFPVFNLVTNEAGYVTTVNYKWMILNESGTGEYLSSAEDLAKLKTTIEDTWQYSSEMSTTLIHASPWVSLLNSSNQSLTGDYCVRMSCDNVSGSIDINSYKVKLSELNRMQASYNLTSRVICKFDLY